MSKQCRWLHDWGVWGFVEVENRHTYIGAVIKQYRTCVRCEYSQMKFVEVRA